jgi:hypothetical protein
LGVEKKEFDMLDERLLPDEQMRNVCAALFGVDNRSLPDPVTQYAAFRKEVSERNDKLPLQWHAGLKKMEKWIVMEELDKAYKPPPPPPPPPKPKAKAPEPAPGCCSVQ